MASIKWGITLSLSYFFRPSDVLLLNDVLLFLVCLAECRSWIMNSVLTGLLNIVPWKMAYLLLLQMDFSLTVHLLFHLAYEILRCRANLNINDVYIPL